MQANRADSDQTLDAMGEDHGQTNAVTCSYFDLSTYSSILLARIGELLRPCSFGIVELRSVCALSCISMQLIDSEDMFTSKFL